MTATATALAYADSAEHLADELCRLDLLIRHRLAAAALRNEADPPGQAARTVYISRAEVDWLLEVAGAPSPAGNPALERLSARIDARVRASMAAGVPLTLPTLGQLFGLSTVEQLAVVVCLAPELRRKYDRLYAYLQDDITRQRPSVELVLDLLFASEPERWAGRALLTAGAPLLRTGVLRTVEDPQSPSGSAGLATFLSLDPGICHYLLGGAEPDPRLAGLASVVEQAPVAAGPQAPGLLRLATHHLREGRPLACYLYGPAGVGRGELAAHVSAALGYQLLSVDAERLDPDLLRLAFRDGLLRRTALHVDNADTLGRTQSHALAAAITDFGWLTFLAGTAPAPDWPHGLTVHPVAMPLPDLPYAASIWRQALTGRTADPAGWAAELAARYRLPASRINAALALADNQRHSEPAPRPLVLADLYAACRQQSAQALGTLAVRVRPRAGWDDLVLPAQRLALLREVADQVRHHHQVFGAWGFGARRSHGTGLSVLFSGPPGTGKTMAAEVLAGELALELYKVDLSGMVSKYIGETEKNLERVFGAARDGNAVLFFDEADALFGKRTEVSDAHDRYANIETSYLLQKLEEHEGLVILATNLRQNLDEAFTRRIRFVVDFPFPEAAHRERIWRTLFPPRAPLGADVDLAELAGEYAVAGASIRNIALNAAFLAAATGTAIQRRHLLQGTRQEYEKIGKLWTEPRTRPC